MRFNRPAFTYEDFNLLPPGCQTINQPAIDNGLAFFDWHQDSFAVEIARANLATTFAHMQCRNSELSFGLGCPGSGVTPPPLTQGATDVIPHMTFTELISDVPFWDLTSYIRTAVTPSNGIWPVGAPSNPNSTPASGSPLNGNSVGCPAETPILNETVYEGGYDVVPLGGGFGEIPSALISDPLNQDGTYVIEMTGDATTPDPDTQVFPAALFMGRQKSIYMVAVGGIGNRRASVASENNADISGSKFRMHDIPYDGTGQTITFEDSTKVDQVAGPPKEADYPLEEDLPFDDSDPVAMVMEGGTVSIREFLHAHLLERGVALEDANLILTSSNARITGAIGGAGSNLTDTNYPKYGIEYTGGMRAFKEAFSNNRVAKASTNKTIQGYWIGASAKRNSITVTRSKPNVEIFGSEIGANIDHDFEATIIV